jgi:hypothetical protein
MKINHHQFFILSLFLIFAQKSSCLFCVGFGTNICVDYRQIFILSLFSSSHRELLASCDLVLLATYIIILQCILQPPNNHPHPLNTLTTNTIETQPGIMDKLICMHERCQRKAMKHGNGYCHLHGKKQKCQYPQCSNYVQSHGVCVQHGYK